MQAELQITFRGITPTEAIESMIREKAAQLESDSAQFGRCRVVIEAPHRHQHKGKLYRVCIEISVRGREIVVNRGHAQAASHEDLYVCISDAFSEARRQLQDRASREHESLRRRNSLKS